MNKTQVLHIDNSSELLKFRDRILQLFFQCFNRLLDVRLWEWAYIKNPAGNAIVNLAFLDNQLVGHYAFIPIKTTKYRVLLSMTTMVAPHARKHNVFLDLAEQSYLFAKKSGFDFVVGFPNSRSAIIHEQILGWQLEKAYVAQCEGRIVAEHVNTAFDFANSLCALELEDRDFLNWRLSKPNMFYKRSGQVIYKTFNQTEIDLLVVRASNLSCIASTKNVNFLTKSIFFKNFKKFDYPFAYKNLKTSPTECNFCVELLMSDVF